MRRRRFKRNLLWTAFFCALLLLALGGILVRSFAAIAKPARRAGSIAAPLLAILLVGFMLGQS